MGKKSTTSPNNPHARTITWASNHPSCPSGYGSQTAQVVKRLHRDGHRVSIANNYGAEGFVSDWNGVRVWPKGLAHHSEDVVTALSQAWAAENHDPDPLTITLYDVFVYGDHLDSLPQVASWVPVDHVPAPGIVLRFLRKPNVTPIAMSRFGLEQITNAGVEALYVPHAVEPVWRPTAAHRGRTGRELMGVPEDAFCITVANANKADGSLHRKAFPENLAAATDVLHRRPDAWLYLHTEAAPSMGGLDVRAYLTAINAPMDRVAFVNPFSFRMGMSQEAVAAIYTASDVLLSASMGEGFGLTVLEAQATGTPVIVSDFTAQTELVGDGWAVRGQPIWHLSQSAFWLMPSVEEIVGALDAAYERGRERSPQAIEFARQYDADRVYEDYWKPALAALAPKAKALAS